MYLTPTCMCTSDLALVLLELNLPSVAYVFAIFFPLPRAPPTPGPPEPTDPMSEASGAALVNAFERLLAKNIVAKAVLAAWHQQHQSREKKSLTPAAEAFFKKHVLA